MLNRRSPAFEPATVELTSRAGRFSQGPRGRLAPWLAATAVLSACAVGALPVVQQPLAETSALAQSSLAAGTAHLLHLAAPSATELALAASIHERDTLLIELNGLRQAERERDRLRALLDLSPPPAWRSLTVKVAGSTVGPASRITLLGGSGRGISRGDAVISADGLLGTVDEVAANLAYTLPLTSTRHAVPVEVLGRGLRVTARGDGRALTLEHVLPTADLAVGDALVTSGLGHVFPPGIPVGTVSHIAADPDSAFRMVQVRPAAALHGSHEAWVTQPPATAAVP